MNQLVESKKLTMFIVSALVCFGLMPKVQAVGPDTDGSIAGGNNGEGIGVLVSGTTGIWNTGTGFEALNHLTAGNQNTATGVRALFSDTSGGFNTATGVLSLFSNTSGFFNTATGAYTLAHTTDGTSNTANGYSALYFNTEGDNNTATGSAALYKNSTGSENTANGGGALFSNTTGRFNTASGLSALANNTQGDDNTAVGASALGNNNTGSENIAVGVSAGANLTTGDNNINIGNFVSGNPAESNTIRIGRSDFQMATFIAGISGATVPGGVTVIVDANGHLGTIVSSQRFKEEIKPMNNASEAILALKPVTFHYKKELDPEGITQFGLVAEEVEKVNPDLVARDAKGEVYTVRYEAVNAMLLNEFIKEHRKNEKQEATIARQQKQIDALTVGLQKVSAQLEASKPAPQVVNNP